MIGVRRPLAILATVALTAAAPVGPPAIERHQPSPVPCLARDESRAGEPSSDLYCIELLPAAGVEGASGRVLVRFATSPFGAAVTPGGTHIFDLDLQLDGLPDPGALGPFTTYVAWAIPPQIEPPVRLGVVTNGRVRGRVALDQFLIVITAEAEPDVERRTGPSVLRGASAGMRLRPHDLPFVLAGLLEQPGETASPPP